MDKKREVFIEAISFSFVLLFLYAAISKLVDYELFRAQIGQSPLLTKFAWWVVWGIPSLEVAIALLLSIPRFRLLGLYASFSLMITFTVYIIAILNFSERVPCSCGGVLQNMSWNEHLVFNIGFIALGLVGIILHHKQEAKDKNDALVA